MVTRQVDKRDHFRGALANLLCRSRLAVVHNLDQKNGTFLKRTQVFFRSCLLVILLLASPLLLKPRISKLMLDVRPVWISWRCLKRLSLALPRPLSSSPCVKTPSRVDLPESTLPITATRRSRNCMKEQRNTIYFFKMTIDVNLCVLMVDLLTCWSSGTLRIRTSAMVRGLSVS